MDEKSPLAVEFEALVDAHQKEIDDLVKEAKQALEKAVAICDKYGISYYFPISFLGNPYIPESFDQSKFGEISEELRDLGLLEYSEYGSGWRYSAVCY